MNITLQQAEAAVAAAKKKATALNTKMNISVVDAGSNLVAFARMDGAWIGSVDIAQKKAKTALPGLRWIRQRLALWYNRAPRYIILSTQTVA